MAVSCRDPGIRRCGCPASVCWSTLKVSEPPQFLYEPLPLLAAALSFRVQAAGNRAHCVDGRT